MKLTDFGDLSKKSAEELEAIRLQWINEAEEYITTFADLILGIADYKTDDYNNRQCYSFGETGEFSIDFVQSDGFYSAAENCYIYSYSVLGFINNEKVINVKITKTPNKIIIYPRDINFCRPLSNWENRAAELILELEARIEKKNNLMDEQKKSYLLKILTTGKF